MPTALRLPRISLLLVLALHALPAAPFQLPLRTRVPTAPGRLSRGALARRGRPAAAVVLRATLAQEPAGPVAPSAEVVAEERRRHREVHLIKTLTSVRRQLESLVEAAAPEPFLDLTVGQVLEISRSLDSELSHKEGEEAGGGGGPLSDCAAPLPEDLEAVLERRIEERLLQGFSRGQTPLHLAARKGFLQVVVALAEAAGPRALLAADDAGSTPLHIAAHAGHLDVVRYLVERGGGELLFARGARGRTALHYAAVGARLEVVKYLSDVGGHDLVCQTDENHNSALLLAASGKDLAVVRFLVEAGGMDLLGATGWSWHTGRAVTPLGIAREERSYSIVAFLEKVEQLLAEEGLTP